MNYSLFILDTEFSRESEVLQLQSDTPFGTISVGDSIFGTEIKTHEFNRMSPGSEYKVEKIEHHFTMSEDEDTEGKFELDHNISVFVKKI